MDAPAKEITDLAGVGVGTLYRHFPQRSDLVKAVVETRDRRLAEAAPALSAAFEPAEALTRWIDRFTELLGTKRGLASALHSGDPAFAGLPDYFLQRLGPALAALLDAAAAEGRSAATSVPRTSCTPSPSCASPCPAGGPSTAGGSSASWSTACAAEAGRKLRKGDTGTGDLPAPHDQRTEPTPHTGQGRPALTWSQTNRRSLPQKMQPPP